MATKGRGNPGYSTSSKRPSGSRSPSRMEDPTGSKKKARNVARRSPGAGNSDVKKSSAVKKQQAQNRARRTR